jgi:PAS domain S-box-containing protein
MDLKLEIGVDTWEYAKKALENGSIDFLPMMAYSSERLKSFDFSVPHTIAYDTVFVRKGTPEVVKLEDLSGKTVIIMNRDAAHDYLLSSGMSDKMKLILVDDLPEMFRLLAAGKGDAAIMPKLVGMIVLKKQTITNVEASSEIIDAYNRSFGFAVKKGNTTLLERLNQGLTIVKTTGQYEDLYKKWFGVLEPRGVPWRSVLKYAAGAAAVFLLIGMCLLLWSVSLKKQVALRTRSLEAEIMQREKTAKSLRESEERYRAVFENAAVGIDTLDRDGRITRANPALSNMLGYTEAELKGLTFEEITYPDDRQISKQNLESLMIGERDLYKLVKRYLRKDGEIVWGDLSTSSIKDANGYHIGTVGVIADITDRKLAEITLRDSESRFRCLMETIPDALVVYDDLGRVNFVNKTFERLYGWSTEELVGKPLTNFVPPPENEITRQAWERTLRGEKVVFETQRWTKEGKVLDLQISTAILLNIDGKHTDSIVIHRDITARNKEQEALHNSERTLNTILATSPVGIGLIQDRKFTWSNDAGLKMFGFENQEEIIGQSTRIVYPSEEEYERVGRDLYAALQSGRIAETVTRFLRKDGTIFDARMRMRSVDPSSSQNLMIVVTTDITGQIRAEQEKESLRTQLFQSQKLEALGTLVGGIAHDFNNMLQIMLGYSQFLLEDKKKGEPGYEDLQTIIETGRGGAELVNKLLAFGQQGQVFPVPLDLNHQINQLSTLISHTLPQVVQVDLDLTDGPTTICADHGQLEQLIMNLAINASEAMPNGGTLKIATKNVSFNDEYCRPHPGVKPGSYLMLSISDNGRGMDKATLAKVFDPFFSTKERGSTRGTGLGLSVVKGIVQQQGGHVTAESELGKGTTLKVYFPAIEASLMTAKTIVPTVQSGGAETILVVEDNIPVAEFEQKVLENAGYTVIVATNGQAALDIYQTRKAGISLVILDLLMPEMSGRDCLMELLKIDPSVKVLIASGYAPEDELHKEIRPLVKGFLQKPFAMTQLLDAVGSVLREKRL